MYANILKIFYFTQVFYISTATVTETRSEFFFSSIFYKNWDEPKKSNNIFSSFKFYRSIWL